MFIIIRGLQGSGKSTISDLLAQKTRFEVFHVDDVKREVKREKPIGADFHTEILPATFPRAIERLETYKDKNIIMEETFRNHDFVQSVLDFCKKNDIQSQWFKLVRSKEEILNINANNPRGRSIVNSPETMARFENELNSIKIDGEIEIENDTVHSAIDKILKSLNL